MKQRPLPLILLNLPFRKRRHKTRPFHSSTRLRSQRLHPNRIQNLFRYLSQPRNLSQRRNQYRLPSRNLPRLHRHVREERIRIWDVRSSWIRIITVKRLAAITKPWPEDSITWTRSCISVISRSLAIPYRRFTGMFIPLPTTDSIFGQMDL